MCEVGGRLDTHHDSLVFTVSGMVSRLKSLISRCTSTRYDTHLATVTADLIRAIFGDVTFLLAFLARLAAANLARLLAVSSIVSGLIPKH